MFKKFKLIFINKLHICILYTAKIVLTKHGTTKHSYWLSPNNDFSTRQNFLNWKKENYHRDCGMESLKAIMGV